MSRPLILWNNDKTIAYLSKYDGTPYIPLAEETLHGIFTEHPIDDDRKKNPARFRLTLPTLFTAAYDDLQLRYDRPADDTRWYPVILGLELIDAQYGKLMFEIGKLKSKVSALGVPEITRILATPMKFDIGTSDDTRPNVYVDPVTLGRISRTFGTCLKMDLSTSATVCISRSLKTLDGENVLPDGSVATFSDAIMARFDTALYRRLVLLRALAKYWDIGEKYPTLEEFRKELLR